jgi:putative PIN family toxin of toxin-antitoxin system
MRVLVDANVLLSALWFPNSKLAATFMHIVAMHEVVLCDRNLFEMREVIRRKKPSSLADAEELLASLKYELIPTFEASGGIMRDPKDQPILNAAVMADVDVILTGDKDFLCLEIERPEIMNVARFREVEGLDL